MENQTQTQRNTRRGLLIGGICLALALLAAGAWWLFYRGKKPLALAVCAGNTRGALEEYLEELPNLKTVVGNLEALRSAGALHSSVEAQLRYDTGEETHAYSEKVLADYDLTGKRVQMDLELRQDEDFQLPLKLYYDADQLQIGSTALLKEGEAVTVPVKDFAARWNESALSKMLDLTLPEDLSLGDLPDRDYQEKLREIFGDLWTRFVDSVGFRPVTGEGDHFGDRDWGQTYALYWDQSLLDEMRSQYREQTTQPKTLSADSQSGLWHGGLSNYLANALVDALWELSRSVETIQIRAEGKYLTGLWLVVYPTSGGDRTSLELLLTGEDNPWERFRLSMVREGEGEQTTEASEMTLRCADGKLTLTERELDKEETQSITYDDADGSLTFQLSDPKETDGDPADSIREAAMSLVPVEEGVRFSLSMKRGSRTEDDEAVLTEDFQLAVEYTSRVGDIAPITQSPIKLLELTEIGLAGLAMRVMSKLEDLLPFFISPLQ